MARRRRAETQTSPSYGWTSRLKTFRALFWWGTGGWGGSSTSSAGMVRALLALLVLKKSVQILTLQASRFDAARRRVSMQFFFRNRRHTSAYVTVFFSSIRFDAAQRRECMGRATGRATASMQIPRRWYKSTNADRCIYWYKSTNTS